MSAGVKLSSLAVLLLWLRFVCSSSCGISGCPPGPPVVLVALLTKGRLLALHLLPRILACVTRTYDHAHHLRGGKCLSLRSREITDEVSQQCSADVPFPRYNTLALTSFVPELDQEVDELLFLPGDLGNQLEAKLNKPSVVHYMCSKKTDDYFTLWLNLELLLPLVIDCWIDNIRLVYNTTTKTTASPVGVDVRVPGFGQTYPLEFLDPSKRSLGIYFYTLVQSMVDWGYTRDADIRGAPYDWRKAPNENTEYFEALQKLIETMFETYKSPVALIAHSMGNLYTLYFLNHQTQNWKDKYIHSFVALGAPWGGVSKTMRVLASGDNNRIPVISSLRIRDQQRSAVSTNWLLPYRNTWSLDKVFVRTQDANYTLQDYQKFYNDIGFPEGWVMRKETEGLISSLTPPGVPVHCLYGTEVDTPDSFQYDSFPDKDPSTIYGPGDGTVNIESALQCRKWAGRQKQAVSLVELPGNEHIAMLSNMTTISYIKMVLLGK